ncbi:hypothetical protein Hte_010481 [Hypoxylon texense]
MGKWEVELGKPLNIMWAGANDAVNITLVKATTRGFYEAIELIGNYTEDTFPWTLQYDLGLGQFMFRIYDEWSIDESPRLSLSSHSLQQNNVPRNISDSQDESGDENDGQTPGAEVGISVGSTLGGIFLLGLVAFFVYRGRQSRTKLDHQEAGGQDAGKPKADRTAN